MAKREADQIVEDFFNTYGQALLARDAGAIAAQYAVPGLILFPGQSLPVTSPGQTAGFFAGAFGQYEGVDEATSDKVVWAATDHSIWVDVTWSYNTGASEQLMYQLVDDSGTWKIAVLTPLAG